MTLDNLTSLRSSFLLYTENCISWGIAWGLRQLKYAYIHSSAWHLVNAVVTYAIHFLYVPPPAEGHRKLCRAGPTYISSTSVSPKPSQVLGLWLGVDKYFLNECILKIKKSLLFLSCRAVWGEMMTDDNSSPYAWIKRKLEFTGGVFSQNFGKPNEQTVQQLT